MRTCVDEGHLEQTERTILFSDVVASTELIERQGDAMWVTLLDRHTRTVAALARSHHGRLANFMGDGHMVAFERPDDAVACALRLQFAFSVQAQLGIRLGLHDGPVLPFAGESYVGMTVHIAARLTDLCEAGQITMSDHCYHRARGGLALPKLAARQVSLKGLSRPVHVRTVEGHPKDSEAVA